MVRGTCTNVPLFSPLHRQNVLYTNEMNSLCRTRAIPSFIHPAYTFTPNDTYNMGFSSNLNFCISKLCSAKKHSNASETKVATGRGFAGNSAHRSKSQSAPAGSSQNLCIFTKNAHFQCRRFPSGWGLRGSGGVPRTWISQSFPLRIYQTSWRPNKDIPFHRFISGSKCLRVTRIFSAGEGDQSS